MTRPTMRRGAIKTRRQYRDEVVNGRLRAIDVHFNEFQKALFQEGVGFNIVTDVAVLGLNAAGAVLGSAGLKAALAASSGGIVGTKGIVNKDLYFEKTMPVLLTEMNARRKVVLVKIRAALQQQDVDRYPLTHALVDLEDYYIAGTVPGAVTAIVEEAGATGKKADAELAAIARDAAFVAAAPAAEAILARVEKLSDAQALKMALLMESRLQEREDSFRENVTAVDAHGNRLRTGSAAKAFLLRWVVLDPRTQANLAQWDQALKLVETP